MIDPELSVIVPSYNGGPRLRSTLPRIIAAIAASTVSSAEVIIVDDGSDDANHEMMQRLVADGGMPASRGGEDSLPADSAVAHPPSGADPPAAPTLTAHTTTRRPRVGEGIVSGIVAGSVSGPGAGGGSVSGIVSGGVSDPGAGSDSDHSAADAEGNTAARRSKVGAATIQLLLVCLPRNRGQQEATIIGAGLSRGRLVATLDDDGDHPPEELPAMVSTMQRHPEIDLLYGAPQEATGRLPVYRRLGTTLNNVLFLVSVGKPWNVPVTSFRIIRADLLARALALPIRFPYLSAMLFGASPPPRVVVHRYRFRGTSSTRYSPLRLGRVFLGLLLYWGPLRGVGRLVRRRRPFDIAGGCV